MGRSEKKTDWLGNEYVQHYDDNGKEAGWSEETADWLGNKYTQHYSEDGNKEVGWSEETADWLGNKYTQHYSEDGNKEVGWSEETADWLGNKYTQHYSEGSNKEVGWSEQKATWLGDKYIQHYSEDGNAYNSLEKRKDNNNDENQENEIDCTYQNSGSSETTPSTSGSSSSFIYLCVKTIVIIGITCIALSIIIKNLSTIDQHKLDNVVPVQSSKKYEIPDLSSYKLKLINDMAIAAYNDDEKYVLYLKGKILESAPANKINAKSRYYNDIGINAERTGNLSDAVDYYYTAFQHNPYDVEIINNLSSAFYRVNQLYLSEKSALLAISLSPSRTNAWILLGYVWAIRENTDGSVGCFKNALRYSKNPQRTMQSIRERVSERTDIGLQRALRLLSQ